MNTAHSGESFPRILESMIGGDAEGHTDRLMRFTRAVTGAAFYAPPLEFLAGHHYR